MIEASCAKRTCVLVVQPWTLRMADNSLRKSFLPYMKKLKAQGVLIGYVSYSSAISEVFGKLSDFAFFMLLSDLPKLPQIWKDRANSLCSNYRFIRHDYKELADPLDAELEKNNIDHLLIIGGFREDCVLAIAKSMCKNSRLKGLKIRLIEKLLVSQRESSKRVDLPEKVSKYRKYRGCDISVSKKDPETIYLKYFR